MKCFRVEPEKLSTLLAKIETLIVDMDESLRFKIMLICEEVITNQIRHTDFEDKIPDITVCLDAKSKKNISLVFKDNAKEFNLLEEKEPDITKSLEETELGGLGIFMV